MDLPLHFEGLWLLFCVLAWRFMELVWYSLMLVGGFHWGVIDPSKEHMTVSGGIFSC